MVEEEGIVVHLATNSHDTHLNDAYVRGAVDFMHSRVKNQGCLVMNIENAGASYEYMPMGEVHKSRNFAIGLSGLDLRSADAFAYSLGRDLASSAASMGAGMLASEAGMGGFVSTLAASLAGTYVNTEVLPQRPSDGSRPTGFGSTGSVSYDRNGVGFQAVNVEFDRAEFNAVVNQIKANIFAEALDANVEPEEAIAVVEREIEEVTQNVAEFQEQAKAVKKLADGAKEPEVSDAQEKSSVDMGLMALWLNSSSAEKTALEQQLTDCLDNVVFSQLSMSPREEMLAFVPKNKAEKALKEATLLRYNLEDIAARHPEAAELCSKVFVGAVCSLQGVEYAVAGAVAGPAGIAAKFAAQESASWAIDATVEESSSRAAQLITQSKALQQELANTIKLYTYAGLCIGSVKASKKLVSSLTKSTVENAAFNRPIRIDIIKEPEMVRKAAALPGEWKGQFKLVNEIPSTSTAKGFASEAYSRHVLFKDPKSGQIFRVFQRNDIDPNQIITVKGITETNLQKMLAGKAPYTKGGEQVKIHHMGQDAFGPFVEVTNTTHKSFLHNQFGVNQSHPTNPVDRSEFKPIRKAYWRAYAKQFK